ncbi:carbohydrate kinase [uncultured Olleya sp.]|uniref:carbohydrate kinase family protein n=1 Tax=uncultured Olleya sp. TaxID=757243 RepID=UPI002599DC9B|nr:carbohydrate kinase [uncultured Olleya sp.]
MKNIVCFGEVLWDVFPTHKKIGGAPLNFAIRLKSLNNNVSIISRIGKDKLGKKGVFFIVDKGINTESLQIDDTLQTGKVKVALDLDGQATYDIQYPRAWDNIQLTEASKQATLDADAFVYGSLAARESTTKHTLYELLKIAKNKIFDVNLRPPYYDIDIVKDLMDEADFIKFNDDEIDMVCADMQFDKQSLEDKIKYIAEQTNTKSICVTKGDKGAVLYYYDEFYYNEGYPIQVIDTVGAGDSFLATLINKLLNNDNPQEAIDFACAIGAIVAGSEGANPKITVEDITNFIESNS